jgi:hypothetical protein
MSNHATYAKGYSHPVGTRLSTPAVKKVPKQSIDHRESKGPQAHLGLFHASISASKSNDNLVGERTRRPSNYIADKSGKENKTC